METANIERLDKNRYNAILLQTIGLVVMLLETLTNYILNWNEIGTYLALGYLIGPLVFLAGTIWYLTVNKKINNSPEAKSALNNEMHLAYKHRSQRLAFWVTMAVLALMLIASTCYLTATTAVPDTRHNIQPPIICEIAILIGFATLKLSWLTYNKR